MERLILVGENFYGSIMVDPILFPRDRRGSALVSLWDEYQSTDPDCDQDFIPWLIDKVYGFAVDENTDDVDVIIV